MKGVFCIFVLLTIAACAPKETPEGNARNNLYQSMGELTSSLATNVRCFSPVEKTETGLDVIKCCYEVRATALHRAYYEKFCEVKAGGECFYEHTAFPSKS